VQQARRLFRPAMLRHLVTGWDSGLLMLPVRVVVELAGCDSARAGRNAIRSILCYTLSRKLTSEGLIV
jgi:hypothetical protein